MTPGATRLDGLALSPSGRPPRQGIIQGGQVRRNRKARMAATTSLMVSGPTWPDAVSTTYPGRFPLSVERHVMSMVDRFVPGVTIVTLNARYYALHGLVAAEARRNDLSEPDALDLMRRAEVVIG